MVLTHGARSGTRLRETCVLLAGGAGHRLDRMTAGGNKHLLELEGRPALALVVETVLATDSVERLVVVTRPDSVADIEDLVAPARAQVDVVVRVQARPAGTLDAVATAEPEIAHDSFAVHYGDNLFGWRRLPPIRAALGQGAAACLYTVSPPADWRRYAAVTSLRAAGRLIATDLQEKPAQDAPAAVFGSLTGFFRFDTQVFRREAPRVPISPRGEFELTDVLRPMLEGGRVEVIPVEVPWVDFGTEPGFRAAPAVLGARGLSRA